MSDQDTLREKLRQWFEENLTYEHFEKWDGDDFAAALLPLVQAEVAPWRRQFCPAGKHYIGHAIQTRRDPETGGWVVSTPETYVCWACRQAERVAACDHAGMPTFRWAGVLGERWDCRSCGTQLSDFSGMDEGEVRAIVARRGEEKTEERA